MIISGLVGLRSSIITVVSLLVKVLAFPAIENHLNLFNKYIEKKKLQWEKMSYSVHLCHWSN